MLSDKCAICGTKIELVSGSKCTNCYEVERRLEQYIKSKNGYDFVLKAIYNVAFHQ